MINGPEELSSSELLTQLQEGDYLTLRRKVAKIFKVCFNFIHQIAVSDYEKLTVTSFLLSALAALRSL
jgi:hypothetical protein